MALDLGTFVLKNRRGEEHSFAHDADSFDIERRIQQGDATKGWRGDPSARVHLNLYTTPETWEVHMTDSHGERYCAASGETLDHRLIERLVIGDHRRSREQAAIFAKEDARAEASRLADDHNRHEQAAERAVAAFRRKHGAQFDGTTRQFWPVQGKV